MALINSNYPLRVMYTQESPRGMPLPGQPSRQLWISLSICYTATAYANLKQSLWRGLFADRVGGIDEQLWISQETRQLIQLNSLFVLVVMYPSFISQGRSNFSWQKMPDKGASLAWSCFSPPRWRVPHPLLLSRDSLRFFPLVVHRHLLVPRHGLTGFLSWR